MMGHRVVVHFRDGEIVKGRTFDFVPTQDRFHVTTVQNEKQIVTVFTSMIKAVFFVKTYSGNKNHRNHEQFSIADYKFEDASLKVRVEFLDGEVMYGMTNEYPLNRKGFFLFPYDRRTNNQKAFVIKDATASVQTWK